jgi:beta-mannanase
VITQTLTPDSVLHDDWRQDGARGRYDRHFTALARNLVAAGLGGSVIRLAHESNYEGNKNFVGNTRAEQLAWRRFWARAVRTMRRVDGAQFSFDWTINAYWQPLPLASIYPGDGVVDIVGVDAYDSGVRETTGRWRVVATRPNGVNAVADFARAHDKPLSIPEWGLMPRGPRWLGGDDDPEYIDGIARTLRRNRVAYQAYFYAGDTAAQLRRSPRSLARLRALLD